MTIDLAITGGKLVLPNGIVDACLAIDSGRIHSIVKEPNLPSVDETISLNGELVFPGVIDPHVHFKSPWLELEEIDTGTASAAGGGVTMVVDYLFSGQSRTLTQAFHERRKEADSKLYIDYALHAIISEGTQRELSQLSDLMDLGIISFKVFTTYGDFVTTSSGYFLEVFKEVARAGGMVSAHCEDDSIISYFTAKAKRAGTKDSLSYVDSRPPIAEAISLQTMLELTKETGARFRVVHLNTQRGVEIVQRAKSRKLPVTAETCPHYLLLTRKDMERNGHLLKMSPLLRQPSDNAALWRGLSSGAIDMIATDHSPMHMLEDLERMSDDIWSIDPGIPGMETMVPLLFDGGVNRGLITVERLAEITSTGTAKALGLYPRKGVIKVGSDADLTVIDQKKGAVIKAEELHSKADYTPFEGRKVTGVPVKTIVRGKLIMDNGYPGDIVGKLGHGEYVLPMTAKPKQE
ncbi:MAG: dihydroorotase family protein [Candidatus Thorarchaeota archaeon]